MSEAKRALYVTPRSAGKLIESIKACIASLGRAGTIEVMPALDYDEAKNLLREARGEILDRDLRHRIDTFLEDK